MYTVAPSAAASAATDATPGPLSWLSWAGTHFIGLFDAAGKQFVGLITGILPTLIVLLTAMYAVTTFIGEERVTRAVQWAARFWITRYTLMPIIAVLMLTNPICYTFGRFLKERYKPAFYDSAVSFVHPVTTFFPYANAGELFVWLGVASGVQHLGESTVPLALRYFLVGIVVIFLRGVVTERITHLMIRRTGQAVDVFTTSVPDEEALCAVINCGGTARIGVYPRKKIPTIDVYPGGPGGPLAQFITEDIFVSAVGPEQVSLSDRQEAASAPDRPDDTDRGVATEAGTASEPVARRGFFVRFGTAIGYIINTFLAAGRQAISLTLNTVLPFMAYVSLLLGFVIYTGIAKAIGNLLAPLSSNPVGLIVIGVVVALPFLSPILGPGAAVAQIVGVLMGTQIATGALPVQYALPTLFAIDGQVGCDFVPVGLGLGEAKAETVEVGVPAVLFSRLITSPIAVVIAWVASFGL